MIEFNVSQELFDSKNIHAEVVPLFVTATGRGYESIHKIKASEISSDQMDSQGIAFARFIYQNMAGGQFDSFLAELNRLHSRYE